MAIIAKGNQRGGGRQLAAHLMNARDNERVEPGELRGTAAPDLHGAFAEWDLQATATRCKQFLYHLSVSPDHGQGEWTEAQYYAFLDRAEERLGLQDQPRAVVFHVKEGRHHCHCAWSRIDVEQGRAVHLSNDRQVLRRLVQDVAQERGLTLPDGLRQDKGSERTGGQHTNQAEQKQQERSKVTKGDRTALLTAAWSGSHDARSFVEAINQAGFVLARGDGQKRQAGKDSKPVYVVIDGAGEAHSLARQIAGTKAKEIFTRLQDGYALDSLCDVATARAMQLAERVAGQTRAAELIEVLETVDRDAQNATWQDSVDAAAVDAEELSPQFQKVVRPLTPHDIAMQRVAFLSRQQDRLTEFRTSEQSLSERHAAALSSLFERHAGELAQGAGQGSETLHEAEQTVSSGMSFLMAVFAAVAERVTGGPGRGSGKSKAEKKKDREEQRRREERQREQQACELEAIHAEQAREKADLERRRTEFLDDQRRAWIYIEQTLAERSSFAQAFDNNRHASDSQRENPGNTAARQDGQQERKKDGSELAL